MSFQAGTPGAITQPPTASAYLGQGVSYPPAITASGRLQLSVGSQCVIDSITSIMQTAPGERAMQIDYGSNIGTFEPIDPGRLQIKLEQQIVDHEPRALNPSVDSSFGQDTNTQQVNVRFGVVGQANTLTLTAPIFNGPATTGASGT